MNATRKLIFIGSAAAVALICSAGAVGVFPAEDTDPALRAAFDDMALRTTNSLAQWQPASGYVPVNYPTDGSWERMIAMAGH
jgi:hypothetical protein